MPRKPASSPTGSSSGAMPAPKRSCERAQGAVEAGALAVELVDEDQAGQAQLGGEVPDRLGLGLDALHRAHHDDGQVDDRQRGADLAEEVGVPGGVDDVELDVAERCTGPWPATATCGA